MGKLSGSRELLIALDSMKYPNTGLFHFGKSLGEAIAKQIYIDFNVTFYISKKYFGLFGIGNVRYKGLKEIYKLFFPYHYNLCHFTDQYCRLPLTRVRGKKILTIHDLNQIHEPWHKPRKVERHLKRLRIYIEHCEAIVAISRFVESDIVRVFPEAADKVKVIYNGVDKLTVNKGHKPPLMDDSEFLFTIGLVSEKKNFHVISSLLVSNQLKLIIGGEMRNKAYKEKIYQVAKEYGVEERVIFTGSISEADKAWYYQNCKAFVFPSLAEGFGLPVLEAMHFGKPIFLSKLTALPEIGGEDAFYFEDFSPEHMRSVFKRGLESFSEQVGERLKQRAEAFNWNETAKQYIALYQSVFTGSKKLGK